MCGVPYHAVEGYLSRLVQKGYKGRHRRADGGSETGKGTCGKREVIRGGDAGNLDKSTGSEDQNNYLMELVYTFRCIRRFDLMMSARATIL